MGTVRIRAWISFRCSVQVVEVDPPSEQLALPTSGGGTTPEVGLGWRKSMSPYRRGKETEQEGDCLRKSRVCVVIKGRSRCQTGRHFSLFLSVEHHEQTSHAFIYARRRGASHLKASSTTSQPSPACTMTRTRTVTYLGMYSSLPHRICKPSYIGNDIFMARQ